jgi:hypothetical protein
VWASIETNRDIANFSIYAYNAVADAKVSIVEIPYPYPNLLGLGDFELLLGTDGYFLLGLY